MKLHSYAALGLSALLPTVALADFQYQETTQITGGSLLGLMKLAGAFSSHAKQLGAPIVSMVYVQGNRMARVDAQTMEIIDLDKETITNVNLEKRTYTQMTFEQMRQQFDQAVQQAKAEQAKQKAASAPPPAQPPPNVDWKFKANVRNTGASKQVSGLSTSESILTLQMEGTNQTNGQTGAFAITNDMWLAPEIPGYEELRDFNAKMAQKMGYVFGGSGISSSMAAMQPGAAQGFSTLAKEVSKLKGIPVEQVMRMGATANGDPLPAASEAPLPANASGPQMPSAGEVAQQSAASEIASRLGGFGLGGFGHKKKTESAPADSGQPNASQPAATVLLESQTTMTSFASTSIDASKLSVPDGFTEIVPRQVQ